jgi:hypothetical protein
VWLFHFHACKYVSGTARRNLYEGEGFLRGMIYVGTAHAKIPEIYLVWLHRPKASLSKGRWRFDGKRVDTYRDRCSRLIYFECTFCADRRS